MDISKEREMFGDKVDLEKLTPESFFIGLINEFSNYFQTVGDGFFDEMSWKQEFMLQCITFFKEPPTIRELAEFLGNSHQNTKQILTKLERTGFVTLIQDEDDRRKQRIIVTKRAVDFLEKYKEQGMEFKKEMFEMIDSEELETAIKVITQLQAFLKQYQEEKK